QLAGLKARTIGDRRTHGEMHPAGIPDVEVENVTGGQTSAYRICGARERPAPLISIGWRSTGDPCAPRSRRLIVAERNWSINVSCQSGRMAPGPTDERIIHRCPTPVLPGKVVMGDRHWISKQVSGCDLGPVNLVVPPVCVINSECVPARDDVDD